MKCSIFSYNVTRPYPYPWFTWIVIFGGIVTTALLTLVNVAANGFEPNYVYKSNLSETEYPSSSAWYEKIPWSFASKVKSTCQDQMLQMGSRIQTSSGLFQYELVGVTRLDAASRQLGTSFAYHGEPLQNCELARLRIEVTAPLLDIQAIVDCTVVHNNIETQISLSIRSPGGSSLLTMLPIQDIDDTNPLSYIPGLLTSWVAEGIVEEGDSLQYYWLTSPTIDSAQGNSSVGAQIVDSINGTTMPINSTMNGLHLKSSKGAQYLSTWSVDYSFNDTWQHNMTVQTWSYLFGADLSSVYITQDEFNTSNRYATTVCRIDYIAKILRSAILSDLGQTPDNNIFANVSLLWESLRLMVDWLPTGFLNQHSGTNSTYVFDETTRANPGSLLEHLQWESPIVQNVTIETLYLCQIPKQKPVISLILLVSVADFVFLSAIWAVFSWVAKGMLERQAPNANLCVGCIGEVGYDNSSKMKDRDTQSRYMLGHVISGQIDHADHDRLTFPRSWIRRMRKSLKWPGRTRNEKSRGMPTQPGLQYSNTIDSGSKVWGNSVQVEIESPISV